jgi:N-formylglutamate deformylase
MTDVYSLHRGTAPLVVSLPHVGTEIPAHLRQRYAERALAVADTDWFLDRLYAFVKDHGASLLVPRHSRYVIDLNRPSDNRPMYAGQNNTELCPTRSFTGEPIYRDGQAPTEAEVQQRVATYWQPYHDALAAELARVKAAHGHVVLFDGHSIKSELPWLFDGRLPDLNLGTANGAACDATLASCIVDVFAAQTAYSHVLNGRFKGGHITRHYGNPAGGVHAVQLEMCWCAYMDESPPFCWHDAKAAAVTPLLTRMIDAMASWRPGV